MKKSILISTLILCSFLAGKALCNNNGSQKFINLFTNCTKFVNNNERRISAVLGWSNRRCYYKEISYKEDLVCGFKELELKEVATAMKKENFDHKKGLSSLMGVQKYLLMPEVCTVNKRDKEN